MGLFDRVGNIAKGFVDIGLGVGKFGIDVVHSGYEIAQGDFDDGFEILLGSVQEDLMGQTLSGAFGPEGVVGSLIGALPEQVRSPGRQVVGPAFEAWDWVMQEVVDRPLGTVATMLSASINGRPDKIFDSSAWASAWDINDKRTLGQSVAAAIYRIDPFDEAEYAKIEDDPLFDLMSGFVDFVQEIYLDPVERFARGAKNLATGKTVVAVSKTGRLLDKVEDFGDAHVIGRRTAHNRMGLELSPERVYVRGGGKGWRSADAEGKLIKSKGIFPGKKTKTLTREQRTARAMIAQPINSLRAQSALNLAWWQRAQSNMGAFDNLDVFEEVNLSEAKNGRLQGLKDAIPRRMAGKGKGMPEQAFELIARGATPEARDLTFRALMGDMSVWDDVGEFGDEIREMLGPDANGQTFYEKVREIRHLRKLDEEARAAEKEAKKRERDNARKRAAREAEEAGVITEPNFVGKSAKYFKSPVGGGLLPFKMKVGYRSDGNPSYQNLGEAIEDMGPSGTGTHFPPTPEEVNAWLEKTGLDPDLHEVIWVTETPRAALNYASDNVSYSEIPGEYGQRVEVPDIDAGEIYIPEGMTIEEVVQNIENQPIDLTNAVPIEADGFGGFLYVRTKSGKSISETSNLTDTGTLKGTVEEAGEETVEEAVKEPQVIKVTKLFVDDHLSRDLPMPEIVKETKTHYFIKADFSNEGFVDLFEDAKFYADGDDFDKGLRASARALAKKIDEVSKETVEEVVEEAVTETPTPALVEEAATIPETRTKPVEDWADIQDVANATEAINTIITRTGVSLAEAVRVFLERHMTTRKQIRRIADSWDEENTLRRKTGGIVDRRTLGNSPFNTGEGYAGRKEIGRLSPLGKRILKELFMLQEIRDTLRVLKREGEIGKVDEGVIDELIKQIGDDTDQALAYFRSRLTPGTETKLFRTRWGPEIWDPSLHGGSKVLAPVTMLESESWKSFTYKERARGIPVGTTEMGEFGVGPLWGKSPEALEVGDSGFIPDMPVLDVLENENLIGVIDWEDPNIRKEMVLKSEIFGELNGKKVVAVDTTNNVILVEVSRMEKGRYAPIWVELVVKADGTVEEIRRIKSYDHGLKKWESSFDWNEELQDYEKSRREGIYVGVEASDIPKLKEDMLAREQAIALGEAIDDGSAVGLLHSAKSTGEPVEYELHSRMVHLPESSYEIIEWRIVDETHLLGEEGVGEPVRLISYTAGKSVKGNERIKVHPHVIDEGQVVEVGMETFPPDVGTPALRRERELTSTGRDQVRDLYEVDLDEFTGSELARGFGRSDVPQRTRRGEVVETVKVEGKGHMFVDTTLLEEMGFVVVDEFGDDLVGKSSKDLFNKLIRRNKDETTSKGLRYDHPIRKKAVKDETGAVEDLSGEFTVEAEKVDEQFIDGTFDRKRDRTVRAHTNYVVRDREGRIVGKYNPVEPITGSSKRIELVTAKSMDYPIAIRVAKTQAGTYSVTLTEEHYVAVGRKSPGSKKISGKTTKEVFDNVVAELHGFQMTDKFTAKGEVKPGYTPPTARLRGNVNDSNKADAKAHLAAKGHLAGRLTIDDFVEEDGVFVLQDAEMKLGKEASVQIVDEDGVITVIIDGEIIEKRSPLVRNEEGVLIREGRPATVADVETAARTVDQEAALLGQVAEPETTAITTMEQAVQEVNNWWNDFEVSRATTSSEAQLARQARIDELIDEVTEGHGKLHSVDWETLIDVDYTLKMNMPRKSSVFGTGNPADTPSVAELLMDDPNFTNRLNIVAELITENGGAEFARIVDAPIETIYSGQIIGYYESRMATLYARHRELREAGESGLSYSELYQRAKTSDPEKWASEIVDDYRIPSTLSPLGFRTLRVFNQRLPHSLINWANTQGVTRQVERVLEQASKVAFKIPANALKPEDLEKLVKAGRAFVVEGASTIEIKLIGLDEVVEFMGEISRIATDGGPVQHDNLKNLFETKMDTLAERGDKLLKQLGVETEISLQEAYKKSGDMKNNQLRTGKEVETGRGRRKPRSQMGVQEGASEAPVGTGLADQAKGVQEGKLKRTVISGVDENGEFFSINLNMSTHEVKQASVVPRWDLLGKAVDDAISETGRSSLRRKGGKSKVQLIEEKYATKRAKIDDKYRGKISREELDQRKKELKELSAAEAEELSKLDSVSIAKEAQMSAAGAVNALAEGTMTVWRPLVLLTPKWGLRIQLDETLRRAADIGALSELTNLIVNTRRWKNTLAANGIEFDMKSMMDSLVVDATEIAGHGTGKKPAFREKYGRVYDPESIGDQMRMIQDNIEDFNKLHGTNYTVDNFHEYFGDKAAKEAREIAGKRKVYRPSAARFVIGAALLNPVVGAAWAGVHGIRRWQRLNNVAQLNTGMAIADQLMREAKKLLREAIDEEDLVLQEIAKGMLSRAENTEKFVQELLREATNRGTIKEQPKNTGRHATVDTDLIVNNVEKADALLENSGFGNLNVNGAIVRNAYGDDSAHREMIASENSASSSQMAAVKSRRNFHIKEFKKTASADWVTWRLGDEATDKAAFVDGWNRLINRYQAIGNGFEGVFRIIWSDAPKVERVQRLAAELANSKDLRTRLNVLEINRFENAEEAYATAASHIIEEFDQVVPRILVESEGPTFAKLRARIQEGEPVVWKDVEDVLANPDVVKSLLGDIELMKEPSPKEYYLRMKGLDDDAFEFDDFLKANKISEEEFLKNPEKYLPEEMREGYTNELKVYRQQQASIKQQNLINIIRTSQEGRAFEAHRDFGVANAPNHRTVDAGRIPGVNAKVNAWVEEMFDTLGTIPSDELSRHPYFRTKYEREVVRLVSKHIDKSGEVNLTQRQLQRIEETARTKALGETKDLLYDLAEESRFGEMTRLIFPFFNAWQEVLTRWGRLATENPAFVAKTWRLYQAPWNFEAIGVTEIVDDEGTKYNVFRLPEYVSKIPKSLRPGVLGDITEQRNIRFSKEGLFSMLQSGIPGFGPLLTIPVREAVLADPSLEETVSFMFPLGHPEGGLTQRMISGYLPAWQQNVVNWFWETPTRERMVQSMALQIYVEAEELGKPIDLSDEIAVNQWISEANHRTEQFFIFRAATGLFSPTSTTAVSPYYDLMKIAKDYQKKYGVREGDSRFLAEYGEDLFALTARMTRLNDGVAASATSEKAREVVQELVEAHPAIGAYLTFSLGGSDEEYKFNQAAYRKQQQEQISPADPRKRRERKTVFETLSDVEVELGWKKYDEVMGFVRKVQDDNLASGLPTSLNHSSLIWLRDWKNQELDMIREEHPQWGVALDNSGVKKNIVAYVDGFLDALNDPHIQQRPSTRHLVRYFDMRGDIEEELVRRKTEEDGSLDLSAKTNSDLLLYWEIEREKFGMIPEFSKIYDRYFARDMIPEESFVSVLKGSRLAA